MLEPKYNRTKVFLKKPLTIEMDKPQIFMNKPVYLGLSTLEISKITMCELWYDYVKPKYEQKPKLC